MQNKDRTGPVFKRHMAAAVALPVFVAYVYYLPPSPYFLALIIVAGMAALHELFAMYRVPAVLNVPGVVLGGIMLYVFCVHPAYALEVIFWTVLAVMLLRMFLAEGPSGSMSEIGPVGIGFMYITVCLSFHWVIRNLQGINGLHYIFALYMSVWLADTMAFYIGTYTGKHRLCPSISPKKTVEGAFGSVLGGIAGMIAAKALFGISGLTVFRAVAAGVLMGITSLAGDLIESMFKRDAGVKDSGSFMPGHGGILDRIDGLLVSGPVLYFIVRYF